MNLRFMSMVVLLFGLQGIVHSWVLNEPDNNVQDEYPGYYYDYHYPSNGKSANGTDVATNSTAYNHLFSHFFNYLSNHSSDSIPAYYDAQDINGNITTNSSFDSSVYDDEMYNNNGDVSTTTATWLDLLSNSNQLDTDTLSSLLGLLNQDNETSITDFNNGNAGSDFLSKLLDKIIKNNKETTKLPFFEYSNLGEDNQDSYNLESTTTGLLNIENVDQFNDNDKLDQTTASTAFEYDNFDNNNQNNYNFESTTKDSFNVENVDQFGNNDKLDQTTASTAFEYDNFNNNNQNNYNFESTTTDSFNVENVDQFGNNDKLDQITASTAFEYDNFDNNNQNNYNFESTTTDLFDMENVDQFVNDDKLDQTTASTAFKYDNFDNNNQNNFKSTTTDSFNMENVDQFGNNDKLDQTTASTAFEYDNFDNNKLKVNEESTNEDLPNMNDFNQLGNNNKYEETTASPSLQYDNNIDLNSSPINLAPNDFKTTTSDWWIDPVTQPTISSTTFDDTNSYVDEDNFLNGDSNKLINVSEAFNSVQNMLNENEKTAENEDQNDPWNFLSDLMSQQITTSETFLDTFDDDLTDENNYFGKNPYDEDDNSDDDYYDSDGTSIGANAAYIGISVFVIFLAMVLFIVKIRRRRAAHFRFVRLVNPRLSRTQLVGSTQATNIRAIV